MAVSPHSHRHIHQYFRHGQHVYLIPTNRFTSALDKYGGFTSFHLIVSPVSQTSNEFSRVLDMDCGFTSFCPTGSPLSWAWTVGSPHLSNRFTIVLDMDCGFTSFCPTGSPLSQTCIAGSPHSVRQVHHCLGHVLWVHLEAGDGNLALSFVSFS